MRFALRFVTVAVFLGISARAFAVDHATLLVKLTPSGQQEQGDWSQKTGRNRFDLILEQQGISDVTQVFPLSQTPANLRALARRLNLSDFAKVRVRSSELASVRDLLRQASDVEWVEESGVMQIAGTKLTPNDPFFSTHQYSLHNTGTQPPYDPGTPGADAEMEAAWQFTTGDTSVVIAIIDTGVDLGHPEFVNRIWINDDEVDEDFVDNDNNGYVDDTYGYDFANNDPLPFDDHQHGTHCAGIAAATGNNGTGIAGMNWQCRIMAVKVLDLNGSGTFEAISQGIVYATNQGADIINLSLGGSTHTSVLETAIQYAVGAGVIVVAAMGNDNSGDLFYPAAYDSVISVGATNSRDERAIGDLCPFDVAGSNFGPWIDVCAAGDVVWSTFPASQGNYGEYCLTSMAGPHVVGLASLIRALRPGLSADSVRHYIARGAEDQVGLSSEDTPGFDIYHGWGRINGRISLQALALEFAPTVSVPGPQSVVELDTLTFMVSTFDSNLTDPQLALNAPLGVTMNNQGYGKWEVTYIPGSADAGAHQFEFVVSDVDGNADTAFVEVTVIDGCTCDCSADPAPVGACDGLQTVLDVTQCINVAFRSAAPIPDPNGSCPYETTDTNCDSVTTILDVTKIINVAFRAANPATEFCAPCP